MNYLKMSSIPFHKDFTDEPGDLSFTDNNDGDELDVFREKVADVSEVGAMLMMK